MVLRNIRPEDLPVPEEASDGLALEDERRAEEVLGQEPVVDGRSQVPSPERFGDRERFRTPESWSTGMKGEGKSGVRVHEVPSSASKRAEVGLGSQSQGLLPPEKEAEMTEGVEPGWSRVMDDEALQRALEQEVVAQLHQENTDLKRALEELQEAKANAGSTTSSWSEVTPPPPPYEHGSPRASGWKLDQGGADNRFTPGGTKVPEGPPPPDEPLIAMPPWPVSCLYYEKDVRRFPCANTLGMVGAEKVTANLNQRALHPPVCRGGMDSRMDLSAGDCRGGMDSRHGLHGQERRAEKRTREELDQDNQGFRTDVLTAATSEGRVVGKRVAEPASTTGFCSTSKHYAVELLEPGQKNKKRTGSGWTSRRCRSMPSRSG